MKLRCESMYGFYHGQDPRTFSPDSESCTVKEIEAHRSAVAAAESGAWEKDGSGCHVTSGAIFCTSSFGIGAYCVVMDDNGNYVRDASHEDYQREGWWQE